MDDIEILRTFADYNQTDDKINFFYQSPEDKELIKTRNFFNIQLSTPSQMEIALILMNMTFKKLLPGNSDYSKFAYKCNAVDILSATNDYSIRSNCLMYSVVLSEALLSYGIKSRVIICRPYNFDFNTDCHCMVHVYIKGLEKWIIFDPANNSVYRNSKNEFLSISELRTNIIRNENITIFGFNKKTIASRTIINYLSKYLVAFFSLEYNGYNCHSYVLSNTINILLPKKYMSLAPICTEYKKTCISFSDKEFWNS